MANREAIPTGALQPYDPPRPVAVLLPWIAAFALAWAGAALCDPLRQGLPTLIWLACWAPSASAWIGAHARRRSWRGDGLGLLAALLWPTAAYLAFLLIPYQASGPDESLSLTMPLRSGAVLSAYSAAGYGLGRALGSRGVSPWAAAGALALFVLACDSLALRGVLGGAPWPPGIAAGLLRLSPSSMVSSAAGFDWLRLPAIYAGAGTDRFPGLRLLGPLAAGVPLLVGCAGLLGARRP